jgi:hypothetical protein
MGFNFDSEQLDFFATAGTTGGGILCTSAHSVTDGSYPMKYPAMPVHTSQIMKKRNSTTFLKHERPFFGFILPAFWPPFTCTTGVIILDADDDVLIIFRQAFSV